MVIVLVITIKGALIIIGCIIMLGEILIKLSGPTTTGDSGITGRRLRALAPGDSGDVESCA